MIDIPQPPDLDTFLAASADEVARITPPTVLYAPGGTRRRAVLAGISPSSERYASWSNAQMIASAATFFRLGVQHLIMTVARPKQFAEVGAYRERLMAWLIDGFAGQEPLAAYARHGWRVRIMGAEELPELHEAAQRLQELTPPHWQHTLWFYVGADEDSSWRSLLAATQRAEARTRDEAIVALYGEPIPLATLLISFGKPFVAPDIAPPLLMGELQSYWVQRPGFILDEQTLRRILYDYAYLRQTWRADKTQRYHSVLDNQNLWEQAPTVGLGTHIGGFWYPLVEQPEHE